MMLGFNNILNFIGVLDEKHYRLLTEIGMFYKSKMDYHVPVDSGYLKSRNSFKVTKYFYRRLRMLNDCEYAGYVEKGTVKMAAQPFIYPATHNYNSQVKAIIRRVYGGL